MLLMSYAYYYSYYEKSPNDKPKGAHHTPGRGVVGTLRLVNYKYYPLRGEKLIKMFSVTKNQKTDCCRVRTYA